MLALFKRIGYAGEEKGLLTFFNIINRMRQQQIE